MEVREFTLNEVYEKSPVNAPSFEALLHYMLVNKKDSIVVRDFVDKREEEDFLNKKARLTITENGALYLEWVTDEKDN